MAKRRRRKILIAFLGLIITGLCIPQNLILPVKGATHSDYNHKTFWFYPWGKSGTHKGVDIFAKAGTPVLAATGGIILWKGTLSLGGNTLAILGPKWRIHYYAHLQSYETHWGAIHRKGSTIGTVGSSGNATGKPHHLHYSLVSILPLPWRIDAEPQGWLKMFFLNPIEEW